MSNESEPSGKSKPPVSKPEEAAKAEGGKPAAKTAPKADAKLPAFDEPRLTYAELAPFASQLDPAELVRMARDGRAIVRANAALGLAAIGHPVFETVAMLRDSDLHAATAAAEAFAKLGLQARSLIPQVVQALDSTQPEVTEAVVITLRS
jgi:hypothetical protein